MKGQITITDFLKSKIEIREVKDFTSFLNSQGKAQYTQIGEIVKSTYEKKKNNEDFLDAITNAVSIYVLNQSIEYSKYLRKEAKLS